MSLAARLSKIHPVRTFGSLFAELDEEDQKALKHALLTLPVAAVHQATQAEGLRFTFSMLRDEKTRLRHEPQ